MPGASSAGSALPMPGAFDDKLSTPHPPTSSEPEAFQTARQDKDLFGSDNDEMVVVSQLYDASNPSESQATPRAFSRSQSLPSHSQKRSGPVVYDNESELSSPTQPSLRGRSEETSNKCRTREVDFSADLRNKLYSSEASIARLKAKIREQNRGSFEKRRQLSKRYESFLQTTLEDYEKHTASITEFQSLLQQKDAEVLSLQNEMQVEKEQRVRLQEQFQHEQQSVVEQHVSQMDDLRQQLMSEMQMHVQKIEKSKTAEIETQIQQHVARLCEAMQAEKQRELASLEQRYSRNAIQIHHPAEREQELPSPEQGHSRNTVNVLPAEADSRNAIQSRHQAEREQELPSPEQGHSRNTVNVLPAEAEPAPNSGGNPGLAQTPRNPDKRAERDPRPPTHLPRNFYTPSLNAIKKIRKGRHFSASTRLIGVDVPAEKGNDSPETIPLGDTAQKETNPQPTDIPSIVNAVSKSVEAALRNLLVNNNGSINDVFSLPKRSPRRQKQENVELELEKQLESSKDRNFILGQVRRLFKDRFDIKQDIDIITHEPADARDVHEHEYEDGAGPDSSHLAFDLTRNSSTPWNATVLNILLQELQERCAQEHWTIKRSDGYILDVLKDRYKRLRTLWLNAQPKLTSEGVPETPAETEARLINERLQTAKDSRQATRRRNKYQRRVTVLEYLVRMKSEGKELPEDASIDLLSWQWLLRLLRTLGEHGMSSEESSVENAVENVLRVKKMYWRRNIDRELDIIDRERILDCNIFCPQGSKPLLRKRAPDNPFSSRDPVTGLPLIFYDSTWFSELTPRQIAILQPSKDKFNWRKVAVSG